MSIKQLDTIYNVIILPFLRAFYTIGSAFNRKLSIKKKSEFAALGSLSSFAPASSTVWFHAASMGEFEQLKSIIERVKEQTPDARIVVSFSSPSGFLNAQAYQYADAIIYLLFDSRSNARLLCNRIQPDVVVINRYDVWWNLMMEFRRHSIPCILVNATYPSSSLLRFKIVRTYFVNLYSQFRSVYAVDSNQFSLIREMLDNHAVHSSSDTRYDRILNVVEASRLSSPIPHWNRSPDQLTLVLGSVWQRDLELLREALQQLPHWKENSIRLIIVPHEPSENFLQWIEQHFPCERLSRASENPASQAHNILVDSVGKLLALYSLADIVYVGGGFSAGVHSVAEAAAYGVAVACGPAIQRNRDALELARKGSLEVIQNPRALSNWMISMVMNSALRETHGKENREYVLSRSGWSKAIATDIVKLLSKSWRGVSS